VAGETRSDPSRGASNLTGRSKCEPVKPRKRAPRETDCGRVGSAEPFRSRRRPRRHRATGHMRCPNSPGSERTACQDGMVAKARNHSWVASALPHSEGIAYKPSYGEVAMRPRVGRMGPVQRGRTGTAEPGPERGPLGRRATHPPRRCILMVGGPAQSGTTALTLRCTKGDGKPGVRRCMPGAGLSLWRSGKAPPDRPAFQPYWGKPAVRNERGDRGNVGIMRSPVRASILPNSSTELATNGSSA
jgi:hypothetical protein